MCRLLRSYKATKPRDVMWHRICQPLWICFVPCWLFVFVEVCEYPLGNLDRQLVCLECWIIIICVVSMTVKFEGTVSGIPWSDESLAVLLSWGQFNLGRSHASTAWVEAALSTPWIIGTAFWSWLLAFVSRERGVLLSQYEWAPRTELLRDVTIISSVWYRW